MLNEKNKVSRRKMVSWMGALSLFPMAAGALRLSKATQVVKTPMATMLTEDGKLVEVDAAVLNTSSKNITNKELQNWIKHK